MNRKAVSMASIFLVLILGLVVTPATADSNKTRWSFGSFAMAYFSLPGDPPTLLRVEAMDYKISSVGPYEALLLSIWFEPIKDYIPLAGVTDNEETEASMEAMFTGIPSWQGADLVEDDELEVWREGRKVFASLTVAPPVPIMPSYIEFEIYGCIEFQRVTIELPTGYTLRLWYIRSDATAWMIVGPWGTLTADEAFVAHISFMTVTGPAI